jgi:hypothetical protein
VFWNEQEQTRALKDLPCSNFKGKHYQRWMKIPRCCCLKLENVCQEGSERKPTDVLGRAESGETFNDLHCSEPEAKHP